MAVTMGEIRSRLVLESDGETVKIHCGGETEDIFLMALMAVQSCAGYLWKNAKNEVAAEKLIHAMQERLAPTSFLWDMSQLEELRGGADDGGTGEEDDGDPGADA